MRRAYRCSCSVWYDLKGIVTVNRCHGRCNTAQHFTPYSSVNPHEPSQSSVGQFVRYSTVCMCPSRRQALLVCSNVMYRLATLENVAGGGLHCSLGSCCICICFPLVEELTLQQ